MGISVKRMIEARLLEVREERDNEWEVANLRSYVKAGEVLIAANGRLYLAPTGVKGLRIIGKDEFDKLQ